MIARPTVHKGIQMRSRLEARFARFLDAEGLFWQYEPNAFSGDGGDYLPDFLLAGDVYAEVKPFDEARMEDALERMQVIRQSEPAAVLVLATDRGVLAINVGNRWRPASFARCRGCHRTVIASTEYTALCEFCETDLEYINWAA